MAARSARAGLTLIELLLAITIAVLLVAVVLSTYRTVHAVAAGQQERVQTRQAAADAVELLQDDLMRLFEAGRPETRIVLTQQVGQAAVSFCAIERPPGERDLRWGRALRIEWSATPRGDGLALARGRHACFLHQDDLWLEGRLAWILSTLQREPEAPVLLSAAEFLAPSHATVGRWTAPFSGQHERRLSAADWFCPLLVQNYLAIPAPVFRRDLAEGAQPLDENLPYAADWKFWLTLARHHPALYRPQPTVGFRVHPESQTVSLTSDPEAYRRQLESVYLAFAPLVPDTPQGRRWQAAGELGLVANAMMAALFHRRPAPWRLFFRALLRAGPRGTWRYLRASRVTQRLGARLFILLRRS